MNTPTIKYYAKMEYTTKKGCKTPKYTITADAGFMPEMGACKGKDGRVSMYLLPQDRNDSSSTPPMMLQAKDSLNFTGLKDYWIDGKLSGYAYGYPSDNPTYGKDEKTNPFYSCKDDGYLFILHYEEQPTEPSPIRPYYIELIVLEGCRLLISAFCKQLAMGGFNEELKKLREYTNKG